MALIPPDAGIRMRMQTEANLLQPVQPAHKIPAELPELVPGQTFTARIQAVLPENTYQALVAGKQLMLQLPEGAKSGDLLELVVIDRSPKVVIARQVDAATTTEANETAPYPFAKFSAAARLIGQLLPADGETPPPALLNRGQPILPQAPQAQGAAALLAPGLAKAVAQSGLFYESHQAQWVAGRLPLQQLLQEPQGRHSLPVAFTYASAEGVARQTAPTAPVTPQPLPTGVEKVSSGDTAPAAAQAQLVRQVPDELRPLVQQQLEAGASQRMFWHGEVWPQQTLDWEIEWDGQRDADGSEEQAGVWRTALSLTTPRLGRIVATLQLAGGGVRIALATADESSAADLRAQAAQLGAALETAGVPLLAFQVQREAPPGTTA